MLKPIVMTLSLSVLAGCGAHTASHSLPTSHPANPAAVAASPHEPSETLAVSGDAPALTSGPPAWIGPAGDHDARHGHDGNGGVGQGSNVPAVAVATTAPAPAGAATYTCPHHPKVVSDKPGKCPKCKMTLEKAAGAEGDGHGH